MMANSNPSPQPNSTKLAFFGTADFSLPSLQALISNGYQFGLVVTKPDRLKGRGRSLSSPPLKALAQQHDIPLIQPETKAELIKQLEPYSDITAGVVVAYGMILPPAVIDHFSSDLINVHASLLPRWRGPSPIEAAILAGENTTGVTLMRLVQAMDEGPVYAQQTTPVTDTATRPQLYQQLSEMGGELLSRHLSDILTKKLQSTPQDHSQASYCNMIKKSDGDIDWNLPAQTISRQIRAYLGWPGSRGVIKSHTVTITEAEVVEEYGTAGEIAPDHGGRLIVYCGKDALLIKSLTPNGKKSMSGGDFVRGYL